MRVYVRLAEPFWRTVGQRELELELEEGSRLSDLLVLLRRRYPALAWELTETPPFFFVGEEEADPQTPLTNEVQVHLVWPVAGGAGASGGWLTRRGRIVWPIR